VSAPDHTCSRCGTTFRLPRPRPALKDLFLGPVSVIRLDEYLTTKCPKCGLTEDARELLFFGVLPPRAVRWVVVGLVLAIGLVATLAAFN
jgi:DNA-directed RNA polymerase subunit RPC12/RpoP